MAWLRCEAYREAVSGSNSEYDETAVLPVGEKKGMFFSHPYVPLGSVNYIGQYYFPVLNENFELFDAIEGDLTHCTFTPAIGTTFSTAGEVDIKIEYYREYVSENIKIHKTYTQKVMVVDHGNKIVESTNYDIYADGYCFFHPQNANVISRETFITGSVNSGQSDIIKSSSLPWRTAALGSAEGGLFSNASNLTDISELDYANVDEVTNMSYLLYGTGVTNLNALLNWNTFNTTSIYMAFANCEDLRDIHGLANWQVINMESFANLFKNDIYLKSLSGLENWDVRNIKSFSNMFDSFIISSLNVFADWNLMCGVNVSKMFGNVRNLLSVDDLQNWRLPAATSLIGMFGNYKCWYSEILDTNVYIAEDGTNYIDDDFNTYTYAQVQDSEHPLQVLSKDASKAEYWGVQGTNKQAFGSEWSNVPSWN